MKKPILKIDNVSLVYDNKHKKPVEALYGLSAKIYKGDIVSIIGPSGCGKSSLLLLISGLRNCNAGEIWHKDTKIDSPSRERMIIFQDYLLFPWKTAIQNIEFALIPKNLNKTDRKKEAKKYLDLVCLGDSGDNYPYELSGGMQQRIGIARALSANPEILLFDEPFASLDPITRNIIQEEVLSIINKLNKTVIFVTHNIEEAIFLGDKIFIMSNSPGKIIEELNIDFQKPNQIQELRNDPHFIHLLNKIYKILISGK
ncbi:MAG: ABC transporter ATP-binding protein [Patescibacteria group bacterium]|nr:ABC transporter ATP-binding protein [Patescibacteria group bacterium]